MVAPVGAVVSLYVDLRALVAPDDVVETQSGRTYRVVSVRVQIRGKHAGRQHLRCIVIDERPAVARVHTIRWYRRAKRRP